MLTRESAKALIDSNETLRSQLYALLPGLVGRAANEQLVTIKENQFGGLESVELTPEGQKFFTSLEQSGYRAAVALLQQRQVIEVTGITEGPQQAVKGNQFTWTHSEAIPAVVKTVLLIYPERDGLLGPGPHPMTA